MRFRFHDVTIEVDGGQVAAGPIRDLFGGLPPDEAAGDPDIVIRLRAATAQPRPDGPPTFFHGIVDVHAAREDLLVTDGASRALIENRGRRILVDVAEESLREGHLFAHVFLLIALVLALRWRGLFHIHAGALVVPDGRGILVVGGSGAGKSTTTLALLEAGCAYLGDDAIFVRSLHGREEVLALPRPFHVAPRTADAFPRLGALLGELLPAGEKRTLAARAAWPGRERDSMPFPSIIFLPHVTGGLETTITPVGGGEAMGALIESSTYVIVEGLPGRTEHIDVMRCLADGARTFRVGLGQDLLDRPTDVAARLLDASRQLGRAR